MIFFLITNAFITVELQIVTDIADTMVKEIDAYLKFRKSAEKTPVTQSLIDEMLSKIDPTCVRLT